MNWHDVCIIERYLSIFTELQTLQMNLHDLHIQTSGISPAAILFNNPKTKVTNLETSNLTPTFPKAAFAQAACAKATLPGSCSSIQLYSFQTFASHILHLENSTVACFFVFFLVS